MKARLSRSDRAIEATRRGGDRGRVRAVRGAVRGESPASPSATDRPRAGPRGAPPSRRPRAIARNASTAPRSSGAPSPVAVEQRLGLGRRLAGGQRDVDRQDRRPVRGRRQQRRRSPRWRSRPRTAASGTGSRGRGRGRRTRRMPPSPRMRRRRPSPGRRRPTDRAGCRCSPSSAAPRGSPTRADGGIGGRSTPVRGTRSAISDASPVETVTTPVRPRPTRRPVRRTPSTSSAVSSSSSRSRQRMTPAASSAASVTRVSPASDPEWATAAAWAWSLRPTLTAMIGLPSSSARSARARNRSGRLKPSTNRMTELVSGSSRQ